MILIIGGAYQGKLAYAEEKYHIGKDEEFSCTRDTESIDFSKRAILYLDEFVYKMAASGRDAAKYMAENRSKWENSVIIMNDVSCGLVPMDPIDRAYREMAGRTASYLGREARTVIRVFAGIGKNLK